MKKTAVMAAFVISGCASDPVLYDGARNVVVYCHDANRHIQYLDAKIAQSRNPDIISQLKKMKWDIKFSCPRSA